MDETAPASPRESVGSVARVMLLRFASRTPRWDWSGPVEPELEEWRDLHALIDGMREAADPDALREIVARVRESGVLEKAPRALSIQVSACHAMAEQLLQEARTPADAGLAEQLLGLCPPEGWIRTYFDALGEVFDDEGNHALARELADSAYVVAKDAGEDRTTLRQLLQLKNILAVSAEEEAVPEIEGELPELLTAVHIAFLLRVSVVTARRKMTDGTIPSRKFGRQRYVRRVDFMRLFDPER